MPRLNIKFYIYHTFQLFIKTGTGKIYLCFKTDFSAKQSDEKIIISFHAKRIPYFHKKGVALRLISSVKLSL